ncbi:MAG: O-antigen ligase family protein [Phenylobacterium sp.]|uniref:O-antigen ligase family protein n=1 Tax=Phenylobacterium sp. TaxID=1871053 RepID=UPI00271C14AA|nr:O-antigen ligase family protein [Phenylobacterium sp.]MDO9429854.1 O-antigen ligase family protein [Phenylobacterium sp.]
MRALLDRRTGIVLKPYSSGLFAGAKVYLAWLLMAGLMLVSLFYGFFYALTTPFLLTQFVAPLGLLGALVVWALPDMRTAPTRALEILFFAFFIMAILWPNYLAISLPGLPWITSVRLVGFPLAFILLVCVSVSAEFRAKVAASVLAIPGLWVFIAGFAVVQLASVAVSGSPIASLNLVVAQQVSWTAIFFTACYVFLRPGNVEKWAMVLCVGTVGLCFLGLWEQKLEHVPWSTHIPGFLAVGDEYVQKVLAGSRRLGVGLYRVQTIHSTPLGFAEYLALTTPFLIHFMMGPFRGPVRLLAGLSLPFVLYVILATDSRLGVVGFLLSVLVYPLVWSFLRWQRVKGSLLEPAIVLAYPLFFVAAMSATFLFQRIKIKVWGGGAASYSDRARIDQLNSGIPKIFSHPQGFGAGEGAGALGYTNLAGTLTIDNYYMLIALDYGIAGFIFYYGAILIVIFAIARGVLAREVNEDRDREIGFLVPIGISLLAFFIIKAIFSQDLNHTLQFMMMGAAAAVMYRIKTGGAPKTTEDLAQ